MPRSARRYTAGFTTSPADKAAEQLKMFAPLSAVANVQRFIRENGAPISTYWAEVRAALVATTEGR